jgi:hypothetical protein
LTSQPASDPQFRVGIYPDEGGFRDTGFKEEYRDNSNQGRHFTGFFGSGFSLGIALGYLSVWVNERTLFNTKDVVLGELAVQLGAHFDGDHVRLAQDIWSQVCGQTTPLQIP